MRKQKNEQGITLIALVITIIILLILAGVVLSIVFNGGIIEKSQNAVDSYNYSSKNETEKLSDLEAKFQDLLDRKIKPEDKIYDGIYAKFEKNQDETTYTLYLSHEDKYGDDTFLLFGDTRNLINASGSDWAQNWGPDGCPAGNTDSKKLVTKVIIEDVISPKDTSYMFWDFENLTEIDGIDNFNMVQNTNMESMFKDCISLTSLDLSGNGWKNTSNVTSMTDMFYCYYASDSSRLDIIYVSDSFEAKYKELVNSNDDYTSKFVKK